MKRVIVTDLKVLLVAIKLRNFGVQIEVESDKQRIRPGKSAAERLFCNIDKILNNTKWESDYKLVRKSIRNY